MLKDFYELWPGKFSNKTNGVTPRRFLALCNPRLSKLITEHIGEGWMKDLAELKALEPLAEDARFRARWREIKQANKREPRRPRARAPESSWIPTRCSMSWSSAFTNTSAST